MRTAAATGDASAPVLTAPFVWPLSGRREIIYTASMWPSCCWLCSGVRSWGDDNTYDYCKLNATQGGALQAVESVGTSAQRSLVDCITLLRIRKALIWANGKHWLTKQHTSVTHPAVLLTWSTRHRTKSIFWAIFFGQKSVNFQVSSRVCSREVAKSECFPILRNYPLHVVSSKSEGWKCLGKVIDQKLLLTSDDVTWTEMHVKGNCSPSENTYFF